jgi:hypothetical protein
MDEIVEYLLKHMQCSMCSDDHMVSSPDLFEEKRMDVRKENWNLYIKEFENYTALVVYHPIFEKDVMEIFPQNTQIQLKDKDGNLVMVIENVSKGGECSKWIPHEKYYTLYERMMDSSKKYDKKIKAFYLDTFHLSFDF